MDITNYYKACQGFSMLDEEEKYKFIQRIEKSGDYIAESKKDGIWFGLFGEYNKTIGFTRRNNEKNHNLPHMGNGMIIIGELGEATERALERKEIIGHSFIDVFDIHTYDHMDLTNLPLIDRKDVIKHWLDDSSDFIKNHYLYVPYYEKDFVDLYRNEDEGIVLKRKRAKFNSFDWIKVKKQDTWDMVIMGYELSTATSKQSIPTAKNIIVGQFKDGTLTKMTKVTIPIGLGERIADDFNLYKNKIVEIKGFCRTKIGSVRSPNLIRFRDDKNIEDCIFK